MQTIWPVKGQRLNWRGSRRGARRARLRRQFCRLAEEVFPLDLVEMFERQRGSFDVESSLAMRNSSIRRPRCSRRRHRPPVFGIRRVRPLPEYVSSHSRSSQSRSETGSDRPRASLFRTPFLLEGGDALRSAAAAESARVQRRGGIDVTPAWPAQVVKIVPGFPARKYGFPGETSFPGDRGSPSLTSTLEVFGRDGEFAHEVDQFLLDRQEVLPCRHHGEQWPRRTRARN